MKRLLFSIVGVLLLLVLSAPLTKLKASELEAQQGRRLIQTTEMILNCNDLTESAEEYAHSQGWCLDNNLLDNNLDETPDGTTVGSCGTASLFMSDEASTSGRAEFSMFLASAKGPMANVNWNVNWVNWSGGAGSFGGSNWPYSTTWSQFSVRTTGNGFVTGTLNGVVTLWWGGTCSIIPPSDNTTVS